MRSAAACLVFVLGLGALAGCAPVPRAGSLLPTLSLVDVEGGTVAVQAGIPVPSFDWQPRPRIDLDGPWRVEREQMDADLSLTDRTASLAPIEAAAQGRYRTAYDDRGWEQIEVPGTLNPPRSPEIGGWYRRTFEVPEYWRGRVVSLDFGAVNYIADVWLNDVWLGYHEGGSTPFAFDVSAGLRAGERNVIAVRVDNPAWGTRNDIVPWGLTDWWNYGGIIQSVWLEATPPLSVVRADVVPHLDGLDVSVVVRRGDRFAGEPEGATPGLPPSPSGSATPSTGPEASAPPEPTSSGPPGRETVSARLDVYPAFVTPGNLTDADVRDLIPEGAEPFASTDVAIPELGPGAVARVDTSFAVSGADLWSPSSPSLYVMRVRLTDRGGATDDMWTSFGLRNVSVDPEAPRVLLNGEPVMFRGVGLHDETIVPGPTEDALSGGRIDSPGAIVSQLSDARRVGADLIRTAHQPANPLLTQLTDRLGFAVWEEIPLYHFAPTTFDVAMRRGIPQQMLAEMALRDMNRPSVLFHGLANESTGETERSDALTILRDLDRRLDGTRLTGQAAYGSIPSDPTQAPLDVAGFTFYYGVFYGTDPASDTERALAAAHAAFPGKPIIVLEFGRWADGTDGPERQRQIFDQTYPVFERHSALGVGGYVVGATWWTLEDYLTARPGIVLEHFGLFDVGGDPRPVAGSARAAFSAIDVAGRGTGAASGVRAARVATASEQDAGRLLGYLGYGLGVSLAMLFAAARFLLWRGGRATPRTRSEGRT
jgi:Glycosyl hydrolases family 2, sugar binding domain/Glycosyl hydrolases family 2, TIM barrel domain/Glycosyl hydrolases family 2